MSDLHLGWNDNQWEHANRFFAARSGHGCGRIGHMKDAFLSGKQHERSYYDQVQCLWYKHRNDEPNKNFSYPSEPS